MLFLMYRYGYSPSTKTAAIGIPISNLGSSQSEVLDNGKGLKTL